MSSLSSFKQAYYTISDHLIWLESTELIPSKDKENKDALRDEEEFQACIHEMKAMLERAGKIFEKRRGQWD